MTQEERLDVLLRCLLEEYEEVRVPDSLPEKRQLLRSLMNVRPPRPVSGEFLQIQDAYLRQEIAQKGVTDLNALRPVEEGIYLWRGDITRLNADAVVNACNSALLGCFQPLHNCIDNVIHSAAGVQVRLDCNALMGGREEPNGKVRVTKGYNLPAKYIFHTVGPIVRGKVTEENRRDLASCYLSCLDKAAEMGLSSVAFCCISTGVFGYPQADACRLAVKTVRGWLASETGKKSGVKVIFDVFGEEGEKLYARELSGTD